MTYTVATFATEKCPENGDENETLLAKGEANLEFAVPALDENDDSDGEESSGGGIRDRSHKQRCSPGQYSQADVKENSSPSFALECGEPENLENDSSSAEDDSYSTEPSNSSSDVNDAEVDDADGSPCLEGVDVSDFPEQEFSQRESELETDQRSAVETHESVPQQSDSGQRRRGRRPGSESAATKVSGDTNEIAPMVNRRGVARQATWDHESWSRSFRDESGQSPPQPTSATGGGPGNEEVPTETPEKEAPMRSRRGVARQPTGDRDTWAGAQSSPPQQLTGRRQRGGRKPGNESTGTSDEAKKGPTRTRRGIARQPTGDRDTWAGAQSSHHHVPAETGRPDVKPEADPLVGDAQETTVAEQMLTRRGVVRRATGDTESLTQLQGSNEHPASPRTRRGGRRRPDAASSDAPAEMPPRTHKAVVQTPTGDEADFVEMAIPCRSNEIVDQSDTLFSTSNEKRVPSRRGVTRKPTGDGSDLLDMISGNEDSKEETNEVSRQRVPRGRGVTRQPTGDGSDLLEMISGEAGFHEPNQFTAERVPRGGGVICQPSSDGLDAKRVPLGRGVARNPTGDEDDLLEMISGRNIYHELDDKDGFAEHSICDGEKHEIDFDNNVAQRVRERVAPGRGVKRHPTGDLVDMIFDDESSKKKDDDCEYGAEDVESRVVKKLPYVRGVTQHGTDGECGARALILQQAKKSEVPEGHSDIKPSFQRVPRGRGVVRQPTGDASDLMDMLFDEAQSDCEVEHSEEHEVSEQILDEFQNTGTGAVLYFRFQ